jgi:DNA-binding GntR family transcriptional regulator
VDVAVDVLQELIVTGALAPGEPLRLAPLSERLNMSMMPIREALRILESLGLVEQQPRRGARVSLFSLQDLVDTYRARIRLETLAVELAADRFTSEHAHAARQHLDLQCAAAARGALQESRKAHTAFHFTIYEAAGSRWLIRLITPLWVNSERYRMLSLPHRGAVKDRRREHERILEACIRGNSRVAARELHEHLAKTVNVVARQLGEEVQF